LGVPPIGDFVREAKTVLTESTGHMEIEVPRDRAGTFAGGVRSSV
jgi:transposase-like protein